jgi:cardiolipin synthase
MSKRHPWRKFAALAVAAFTLGILPYLFQPADGTTAVMRLLVVGRFVWSCVTEYAPHILTAYIICVAALIFYGERNPDRTVLWLLMLGLLPVAGIILYLLLGPDLKRMRTRKLFKPTKSSPCITTPSASGVSARVRKISTLAFRNSSASVMERGQFQMLVNGDETFSRIKDALSRAKKFINIEYFIFQDDRLGNEIASILRERASSGVKVRMMTDGVGSWRLSRKMIIGLQESGVRFRTFMPVSFPFFRSGINYRNHRKIVVVDGDVAFSGGLNVGAEYMGEGPLGLWRDTHAMFQGDSVRAFNAIFLGDWRIASGETLRPDSPEFAPSDPASAGRMPLLPMQVVPSGSASAWRSISQMYSMMITDARDRIWITTPYFSPDVSILNALQTAALSGIDVRILIPGVSNHFLAKWAGRANIEEMLRAGVRIWRYEKGFIHAKTVLMDDAIASVGTANLDNRSLEINFEVQAFIYDSPTCRVFERQFLEDLSGSREYTLSEWERRGFGSRVLESAGRLWSSQV